MATYKVIQDVEAEDKLLGPLTLRQFIYAAIAALAAYLTYFSVAKGASYLIIIFLPVVAICGFFAFPWSRDQPTEIWALAKIRFILKPRRRIWDQGGAKQLVTITAPRNVRQDLTNGLSQMEVHSRLRALADTIDSRGWAIKNTAITVSPQLRLGQPVPSDRLLDASAYQEPVPISDVTASDDMLDEAHNARAHRVDTMIEEAAKEHREQIEQHLSQAPEAPNKTAKPANSYWFLDQPNTPSSVPKDMVTFNTQVVTPGEEMPTSSAVVPPAAATNQDEQTLLRTLRDKKAELPTSAYYGHLHTIMPLSGTTPTQSQPTSGTPKNTPPAGIPIPAQQNIAQQFAPPRPVPTPPQAQPVGSFSTTTPSTPPVTPTQQAAILQLAHNNDLNVATIAREADRSGQNEVVIKLH